MDNENYEQFDLDTDQIGDQTKFLREGAEVIILKFNEQPIAIKLPVKMDFKVTSTPEGAKGDTAQGRVTKLATIETGAEIAVPMFVKTNDTIRINTETGEYVERV